MASKKRRATSFPTYAARARMYLRNRNVHSCNMAWDAITSASQTAHGVRERKAVSSLWKRHEKICSRLLD